MKSVGIKLSRSDRLLVIALLLIAVATAMVGVWARGPEQAGSDAPVPSSFYNDRGGTKAAYRVMERLGYRVGRLQRRITPERLASYNGLLVLQPGGIAEDERRALLEWVESGGRLVLSPGFSGAMNPRAIMRGGPGAAEPWFNSYSVKEETEEPGEWPSAEEGDPFRLPWEWGGLRWHGEERFEGDDPLFEGIHQVVTRPNTRFNADEPVTEDGPFDAERTRVIWRDQRGAVALRIEHGQGWVIAWGDPYTLSNAGLSQADNPMLLANLARELAGSSSGEGGSGGGGAGAVIAFDEYHHGFVAHDMGAVAMVKLLAWEGRGWAWAQALLAAAAGLLMVSVRFGAPRDLVPRLRRQQSEFVEAGARLIDQAGGVALAWNWLRDHYRGELCRRVHLPADAESTHLAEAVEARCGIDIAPAMADNPPADRSEMLSRARTLHRAVECLRHGTE